jgi:hypothetical protein
VPTDAFYAALTTLTSKFLPERGPTNVIKISKQCISPNSKLIKIHNSAHMFNYFRLMRNQTVHFLLPIFFPWQCSTLPLRDGLHPLLLNTLSLASSYSYSAFKGLNDSAFES